MHGIIYIITNNVNNKVYVGQTTQPLKTRWRHHKNKALSAKDRGSPALHNAMRKYGVDNFDICALFVAGDRPTLDALEIETIKSFDSITSGYNLHAGGYMPMPAASVAAATAKRKAKGLVPPILTTEQRAELGRKNSIRMKGKEPKAASLAKSKPVMIFGISYLTCEAAEKAVGISVKTLRLRLRDPNNGDYVYLCSPSADSVTLTSSVS